MSYSKTGEKLRINSLGVAYAEECTYYEGREDGVVKICTIVDTDAFSAWKELMDGISSGVLKIITLGWKGN